MQLKIVSDLHLEAPAAYDIFEISPDGAQYLALLGDIGHVKDHGLFEFLSKQLLQFAVVFFVLGNHEPYHSSYPHAVAKLNEFREEINSSRHRDPSLGDFVFLNRTRYDISSAVTILGCTLFSSVLPEQHDQVSFGLNDFYHIKDWSVEQHCEAHDHEVAWLNDQVFAISSEEPDRKVVILTHYSPTLDGRSTDPMHRDSKISSGFSTDLKNQACWTNLSVRLWAFGHTHFNCDFDEDGKRVLTNQKGYYFAQAAGFREHKVVELEGWLNRNRDKTIEEL